MKNFIDGNEIIINKRLDIAYCTVALKGINDQPDDGREKRPNM